ncbi:hypothetical protein SS50377_23446 [Spironucleus salmonicida]|uniref:Transmembrane protein n=1 Tax=Spironucleus salmonicida TaxID=348837 RepID=V6LPN2_9EUKA|nr:hypothetical protein SS50377_23446 [Spironucleus salmonicida]|eukprot:EST46183.1 Hypothetical protein SS50377_13778 [Spironucleus salmonicida]
MFDRDYCIRMKSIIKLQIIFVGGLFMVPLLLISTIYVSSAFGYCKSYTLEMIDQQVLAENLSSLTINNGVTVILRNKITTNKQGIFKAELFYDINSLQISPKKALFPCARAELNVDKCNVTHIFVRNAGILRLNIKDEQLFELDINSGQTVSQFSYSNVNIEKTIKFQGTGFFKFQGQVQSSTDISGASGLSLSGKFEDILAHISGNFFGNFTSFKSVMIFSPTIYTQQLVCVPIEQLQNKCIRTLNRHWQGDSGIYIYDDNKLVEAFARNLEIPGTILLTNKIDDMYESCIGNKAGDLVIQLQNRGETVVVLYSNGVPSQCK